MGHPERPPQAGEAPDGAGLVPLFRNLAFIKFNCFLFLALNQGWPQSRDSINLI